MRGRALLLALSACSPEPAVPADDADPVVARGEGVRMRVSDLTGALAVISPSARAAYATPEGRRRLAEEVLRRELLVAEARRRGLDRSLDVVRATKQAKIHALRGRQMRERAREIAVTDEEIRAHYAQNVGEYRHPAERRVAALLVADRARAERIAARLRRAPSADHFEFLARASSDDAATREAGGMIGWVAPGDPRLPEAVVRAAFEVDPVPGVAGPVQGAQGWHVVHVSAWRAAEDRTLEQAYEDVRRTLARERWEALVDAADAKLMSGLRSQVREELLARVPIALPQEPEDR